MTPSTEPTKLRCLAEAIERLEKFDDFTSQYGQGVQEQLVVSVGYASSCTGALVTSDLLTEYVRKNFFDILTLCRFEQESKVRNARMELFPSASAQVPLGGA